MNPYLAFVTHDLKTNTLEATWLAMLKDMDGNDLELRRVKCRNYSAEQKADFLADTGSTGQKYVTMAGW